MEALAAEAGGSQRLLALLGLRDRAVMRVAVAGELWPESSEEHAHSSLRSAPSRLSELSREAVLVTPLDLCLSEAVSVDIREARSLAYRLLDPDASLLEADVGPEAIAALSAELLPDWYDDWVLIEAEEWRQLRLHALEFPRRSAHGGTAFRARRRGRAGCGADRAAPRERSGRGHPCAPRTKATLEALREFARYRVLLRAELGLEPTPRLRALVVDLGAQ